MINKNALLIATLICAIAMPITAELPPAEVVIHVVDDEDQQPVSSVEVRIGFTVPDGEGGTKSQTVTGLTNNRGDFTARGKTLPDIAAKATKVGYYNSTIHHNLNLTRQQVYNPIQARLTIGLRRIGHPVAMYARKRTQIEVPALGKSIGYDLIATDWLPPYGQGTTGDLVFNVNRDNNPSLSNITVSFSNDGDGIQPILATPYEGSALRLPRLAPEVGYVDQLQLGPSGFSTETIKRRNYFYRVRTVKKDGRIASALYGKIYGEVDFDTINSKTAIVLFTYYLNPDGSPNVEFDPSKNLFKNLPPTEQVTEP
jgi:hypothetical protein